jgi:homoserine kinase
VRISVPASSANLGPGFDTLAVALDVRLTATVEWSADSVKLHDFDDPLHWWRTAVEPNTNYSGTLVDFAIEHSGAPNLLATAFVKAVLRAGPEYHLPRELKCRVHSDIPVAQGLGSSAAAVVAGAALAEVWRTGAAERAVVFRDAIEIEGHADNAAAATYGGLQAALLLGDETRATTVKVHESIRVAVCVPRATLKENTLATRSWLPEQLKRKEAVTNQRALLTLLYGLRTADARAIEAGFEDRLHVPLRKSMIAGYDEIVKSAIQAGAYGVTISGAGGSMIALGVGDMAPIAEAMQQAYQRHGMEATSLTPEIDKRGMIVEAQ